MRRHGERHGESRGGRHGESRGGAVRVVERASERKRERERERKSHKPSPAAILNTEPSGDGVAMHTIQQKARGVEKKSGRFLQYFLQYL